MKQRAALAIGATAATAALIIGIQKAVAAQARGADAEAPGKARMDEVGDLARSMERVYQKGLEAARLRSALGARLVMVASQRMEIVHFSNKRRDTLPTFENDIRQDLPNFQVAGLIGANVDVFHKNAPATRGRIAGTVGDIKHAARDIDVSSPQIRDSAEQPSQRAMSTAASLEPTSTSTAEITAIVRQTAHRAEAAAILNAAGDEHDARAHRSAT